MFTKFSVTINPHPSCNPLTKERLKLKFIVENVNQIFGHN